MTRILFLSFVMCAAACAPNIGDSCQTSADCSVNGSRICDLAQPGGYCTVGGCDPDTCPGSSLCVEWRGTPDRTAVTFCMDRCGGDGDCRRQYSCMGVGDPRIMEGDDPLAQIIDTSARRREASFCVADPALLGVE